MEPATMMGAGALLSGLGSVGSLFGGKKKDNSAAIHAQNIKFQEDFAKEGIRWRVADAKAAGIHPLYALGASIPSFSPTTYIPSDTGGGRDVAGALRGLGQASQDFGRAIDSTRTSQEQVTARMNELALTRGELENDLLRSQIAKLNQQTTPPSPSLGAQFIPGQADVERNGLVASRPMDQTRTFPGRPWQDPAAVSDLGFVHTADGGFAPVPSKDAKERMEDMIVPEAMWALRNHLLPSLGDTKAMPPMSWLPDGAYNWNYDGVRQAWYPVYHRPQKKPRALGMTVKWKGG